VEAISGLRHYNFSVVAVSGVRIESLALLSFGCWVSLVAGYGWNGVWYGICFSVLSTFDYITQSHR
jgi:hypothetical protein